MSTIHYIRLPHSDRNVFQRDSCPGGGVAAQRSCVGATIDDDAQEPIIISRCVHEKLFDDMSGRLGRDLLGASIYFR